MGYFARVLNTFRDSNPQATPREPRSPGGPYARAPRYEWRCSCGANGRRGVDASTTRVDAEHLFDRHRLNQDVRTTHDATVTQVTAPSGVWY